MTSVITIVKLKLSIHKWKGTARSQFQRPHRDRIDNKHARKYLDKSEMERFMDVQ